METSPEGTHTSGRECPECSAANLEGAQFCKACGGSIAPPPKCPKCEADVEADANFCPHCGTKLVGPRPAPKNGASKAPAAPAPDPTPKQDPLAVEKAKLPPPKKPSSNMMGNVALFAAIVIGAIAVIVAMNKDKPKEVSPFVGGPPAANVAPPPPPAGGTEQEAAPSGGGPISGSIALDPAAGEAGDGTIFIVLRNAGMPNRGPPIAVKKIDDPSFPVEFQVSAADVMMKGMPFMGPFDIYVRLDRDGNAMTKDAGDLVNEGPAAGIKAGTSGVEIKLNKRL